MRVVAVLRKGLAGRLDEIAPAIVRDNGGEHLLIDIKHPAFAAVLDQAGPNSPAAAVKHWGPAKWDELHLYGLSVGIVTPGNRPAVLAWLIKFGKSLPRSCSCQHDWDSIMTAPPEAGVDLFVWTVDVHDLVNVKLGRDSFGVAAARQKYAG